MQLKSIRFNLPIQIGFMVYQYAKLKMLEFTYDFIDRFISRLDYQLCEMDTDSLYMAISGDCIDALVKPHLRQMYFKEKRLWIPTPACELHYNKYVETKTCFKNWLPSECCLQQLYHDQRKPGLFKSEWEGDGMLCLNPKTYICYTVNENTAERYIRSKWSAKGVVKKQNELTPQAFMDVLNTKQTKEITNTNFRLIDQEMFTYTAHKNGLTYMYLKRQVAEDGVSTSTLII